MGDHPPVIRALFVIAMLAPAALVRAQCDDEPLQEAAAMLLLDGHHDAGSIEQALREAGSDLPHARMRRGSAASVRAWLNGLELDAPLACGSASNGEVTLALAAARAGSLDPIDGGFRIELADGYDEPYLVVQDGEGEMLRLGVSGGRVRVPDDVPRPIRAQLVARGPDGPRPVAIRAEANASIEVAGEGGARARLAALRAAHDVSELRDNALLAREATRHAREVCEAGRARHVLSHGDPERRLERRGIRARVVGEAVARAPSEDRAFDAIARSPAHRMALVDRRFTDVGIGVARHRGQRCVVVTLASWPRAF